MAPNAVQYIERQIKWHLTLYSIFNVKSNGT
jgi:hypothetical protein